MRITKFSLASSLQMTIKAVTDIQNLNPANLSYKIPAINNKLAHLFIMASSGTDSITESAKIRHTLTLYAKIKQPESWAQWVRNKIDSFDEGTLTVCQNLMNSAAIKQMKIIADEGSFSGRSTSLQEDVIAMVAMKAKQPVAKAKPAANKGKKKDKSDDESSSSKKSPPFVKHWKAPDAEGGTRYKVGDTKVFEGDTYHFCNATTHRGGYRWHMHSPDNCRVRQSWLLSSPAPSANAADVPTTDDDASAAGSAAPSEGAAPPAGITAALTNCLTLAGDDNPLVSALIANALDAAANL
eukprot:scaffold1365_cov78-Cylindrotheca_fusiformis.AAC.1